MVDSKVRTLIRVVDEGGFTRAANSLHLTQPAVSHHIRQLEMENKALRSFLSAGER